MSKRSYLVVIPARGGSKGIPRKNIKLLGGIPLIGYTIQAARSLFRDEDICITTDDSEIIRVVQEQFNLKVPFVRPKELATDTASSQDVLLHALDFYEEQGRIVDAIVLLQPTSPFREPTDIEKAMQVYDSELDMVVSVSRSASNPYYTQFEESADGNLRKVKEACFTRRQDVPIVYDLNGAIYVINPIALKSGPLLKFRKLRKIEMDRVSSIDIDEPLDFHIAQFLLKSGLKTINYIKTK